MLGRAFLVFQLVAVVVVASGCGRDGEKMTATDGPTRGIFRAAREGRLVRVELGLEALPRSAQVVTMGLKLADGTPLYPATIRGLSGPTSLLREARPIDFAFSAARDTTAATAAVGAVAAVGRKPSPVGIRPEFWVEVTFELDALARSVNGGTFSLVLGDPTAGQSCGMGITTSVMTRDGSPCLVDCVELESFRSPRFGPMPLPRVSAPPVVSIRLAERAAGPAGTNGPAGPWVPIVPTLAAGTALQGPLALAAAP